MVEESGMAGLVGHISSWNQYDSLLDALRREFLNILAEVFEELAKFAVDVNTHTYYLDIITLWSFHHKFQTHIKIRIHISFGRDRKLIWGLLQCGELGSGDTLWGSQFQRQLSLLRYWERIRHKIWRGIGFLLWIWGLNCGSCLLRLPHQ
jgi:hypothetical protein